MAISTIVCRGFGSFGGGVSLVPTRGYTIGAATVTAESIGCSYRRDNIGRGFTRGEAGRGFVRKETGRGFDPPDHGRGFGKDDNGRGFRSNR